MLVSDDLRFAGRSLAKRPLFTVVVVLTLGLGIGINSAIFSIVNAALFAPLGVRASGELLNVYTTDSTGSGFGGSSYPDYLDLRDHTTVFSGVMGYNGLITTVTGGGGPPEVLFGEVVTGNYFAVTGARLALGRGFVSEEDRTPGSHPVVVLGHGLWQRRFGGDSSVLGRQIRLNGLNFTVVGVAGAEFKGLLFRGISADVWAPVMMMGALRTSQLENRDERWMSLKARLAPGVTERQARAQLASLGLRLARDHAESNAGRSFTTMPTNDVLMHPEGDRVAIPGVVFLLVMVGFVLLIVCTNLGNLMLARASARRRELAVRVALGASRGRLVRQLLTESTLLVALGGAAGLLLALWMARLLVAFRPPVPVPISLNVGIDVRVVAFTVLLSAGACLLLGLVPALQATKTSLTPALAGAEPNVGRRSRLSRMRNVFLVPQLALSLVLLVVAGLFVRSIGKAGSVDPGFDIGHTAMIALDLRLDGYDEAKARRFYSELSRRVGVLPGVRAVTVTDRIPLDFYGNQSTTLSIPGPAAGEREVTVPLQLGRVDARYFDALGIRLVRGRGFTESETEQGAAVAVVSEHAARRFWPRGEALGQRFRHGESGELVEVVGVAADTKIQTLGEDAQPFVYRPISPDYARLLRFIARTSGDAGALVVALRSAVAAIDPDVAVFESKTMTDHLDVMLFPYRAAAGMSTALGLFGLLLASVGLYGVVAFGVARRTREFGIRMALGARDGDVVRLVVREHLRVVGIGVVIGLALALAVARLMAGVLFGVGASDPLTFIGVPAALAVVAVLASYLPARRASRVVPSVALRQD